jgi:hypothetical protein
VGSLWGSLTIEHRPQRVAVTLFGVGDQSLDELVAEFSAPLVEVGFGVALVGVLVAALWVEYLAASNRCQPALITIALYPPGGEP